MLYALSWSVVSCLFALWSFAAWALHAISAWTVSNAGVLADGAGAAGSLNLPGWLAPWVPPGLALTIDSMLSAFRPAVEAMVEQAPALAGGLSAAIWVVWGVGSALLLVLGLVASGIISRLQRR